LSFHRYWVGNGVDTIQESLDMQQQYNIPLWVGETGEESDLWYQDAVALLESFGIGWAWWSWKKMESSSSSFSIKKPDGYQELLNYWAYPHGSAAPDPDFAFNVMMQVAENARLDKTVRNLGAIHALTGHLRTCDETAQVAYLSSMDGVPVRIEAEDYCSMFGFLTAPTQDIGGGFNMGHTSSDDELSYQVNVPTAGLYSFKYRYAGWSGGLVLQSSLTGNVGEIGTMPSTGGWQNWGTVSHYVQLPAGVQTITLQALQDGWNLNWIEVTKL
jgi:hypothetical protein